MVIRCPVAICSEIAKDKTPICMLVVEVLNCLSSDRTMFQRLHLANTETWFSSWISPSARWIHSSYRYRSTLAKHELRQQTFPFRFFIVRYDHRIPSHTTTPSNNKENKLVCISSTFCEAVYLRSHRIAASLSAILSATSNLQIAVTFKSIKTPTDVENEKKN